jgi:hypothetical protein
MRYVIIEKDEANLIDFSEVSQTSEYTLRWNKDKTRTFIKYAEEQPDFIFEITNDLIGKKEYSHKEFLEILKTEEWAQA